MSGFSISVIDAMEGWEGLAEEWRSLLATSRSASFFLSWEWLSAWMDCCIGDDRRLFVVVFHEKGSLVGVAPFYICTRSKGPFTLREVRLLGSPEAGSDYLDVVSRMGREKDIANALYDFLMEEAEDEWDLLCMQDVPADALFLLHFLKRIQAEGKYAELAQGSYCPIVNLPVTHANLMGQLSPWRRKKFKQDIRVINREKDVVHSVFRGDDVASRLGMFFRLYEEKGGWPGETLRILVQRFLDRCDGEKPLQLDMLSVNGRDVAGLLHLKHQKALAMYLMAVDKGYNPKISLGNLLVGLCLKNAIEEGHEVYDFLKGDESYKFHWATTGKSSVQLIFWQKRPTTVIFALSRLLRHAGKIILR
jgi:CelD/BcsL family acetyltransferase involved in cellulose biosynthesis